MNLKTAGIALAAASLLTTAAAFAAGAADEAKRGEWADRDHVVYTPTKFNAQLSKSGSNLVYHNGPTLTSAHVVFIFWGSMSSSYTSALQSFRNGFGTTGEYNVITQYSGIKQSNLAGGTADWFDGSNPPTNVTDADVQNEVNLYLQTHAYDPSAIYEVVIPNGHYSSSGSSDSCGGPNLKYCAYHGNFASAYGDTKYSIEPYPSCGGCQVSGWTDAQNQEHFICHETREAVTDPDGTGWYDHRGYEADDKCAWSPTPFLSGGNGYQYEWSNANGGCVQTR